MTDLSADKRRSLLFFLICFATFAAEYLLFLWLLDVRPLRSQSYRVIANTLVLFIPYWFAGPRWRWTALLPLWLFGIWSVANLCYFRFWNDLIPSTAVTMLGNVDTYLAAMSVSLCKAADLLFLLLPAAATAAYFLRFRKIPVRYGLRSRLIYMAIALLGFAGSELLTFRSMMNYDPKCHSSLLETAKSRYEADTQAGYKFLIGFKGLLLYAVDYVSDMLDMINIGIELSPEEKNEISNFTGKYIIAPSDTIVKRNLILIIVESLNAEVVGKTVNGHEITPTLNRLIEQQGTVSALNVICNIKEGGSGDGQLIINTGLLPVSKGSTALFFAESNKVPSLSEQFGTDYSSTCILSSDGSYWKEARTMLNYGFTDIHTSIELTDGQKTGGVDGAMFAQARNFADTVKEPFFLELVTMSMHTPYRDADLYPLPWLPAKSKHDAYLTATHYFDSELGKFIDYLKAAGKWENTMLAVASDHMDWEIANISEDKKQYVPVVFIAANSGRTERIERVVGQVNIFPTIIELMGKRPGAPAYSGMAPSMLDTAVNGSVDGQANSHGPITEQAREELLRAYELSDKIHHGAYFGKQ